ncbi:MAG TPA: delta-60 repeat domain-containing protein, partial [Gammaproteobacteria bacterium]|nr:delta-60 repeat domain-containing protein [Gammaproteobacteria bacterium]
MALLAAPVSHAAAGDLDSSFGSNGKVTTTFLNKSASIDAMTLQPDGKIIVVGRVIPNAINIPFSYSDLALVRYNADGNIDTGFGSGGITLIDFSPEDDVKAIALQADGKIVIAGSAIISTSSYFDFVLTRYNNDGSLDTGFGIGGKQTTDFFGGNDQVNDMVLQVDGKIVVAGTTFNGSDSDFALARYNSNGALDTSFGIAGKLTTHFSSYNSTNALGLQTDGKIVAAGVAGNGVNDDFALIRYNTDGSLDSGFGNGGKVTTDFFAHPDRAYALAIQADGKIIAAGSAYNLDDSFALARYLNDGSLDASFGSFGKVTTNFYPDFDAINALALQPDGKIVATGNLSSYIDNFGVPGVAEFILARYNPNGSLDTRFGNGRKLLTGFSYYSAHDAVLQTNDKIVVAGGLDSGFGLARYLNDSGLPQPGWWWNPDESGRGFSVEVSQNTLFMAGYLYDASGRATWYASAGPMANNTLYQGTLQTFGNGQTLTGAYKPYSLTNSDAG